MQNERRYHTKSDSKYSIMMRMVFDFVKELQPISGDDLVTKISSGDRFKKTGFEVSWIKRALSELLRADNSPIRGSSSFVDGRRVLSDLRAVSSLPEVIVIKKVDESNAVAARERGTSTSGGIQGSLIEAIFLEMTTSNKPVYADVQELKAAIDKSVKVPEYGISGTLTTMIMADNGPLLADSNGKSSPWRNIRLRHPNVVLPPRLFMKSVHKEPSPPPKVKKEDRPQAVSARLPAVTRIESPPPGTLITGGRAEFIAEIARQYILADEMGRYISSLLAGLTKEQFLEIWREETQRRMT